jgi:hypothetical protein
MFKERARREYFLLVLLGGIFIVSRILYSRAGIEFDAGTLTRNWHFVDTYLLENDLWRSIFYLHTQPPLMNLSVGLALQTFPDHYAIIFQYLFILYGLGLAISIYAAGKKLGLSQLVSFLLAVWFSLSPATVLYENRMIYAYPLLVLLVMSIVFLARFNEKKRLVDALIFSFSLAVMALTWGMFHLVWLLGCFGIVTFVLKGDRRKALWLLPAFLLVFAWYAKNGILYGSFTASTWAGLNLNKTVTNRIPGEVREEWIEEGIVSELALVPPYRSPEVYLEYFPETEKTGIPLLDAYEESDGYRNQHHLSYVYAGERYLKDSIRMIIHAPHYYLETIPYSLYIFFHSASDYEHLRSRKSIDKLDTLWNRLFYGQWHKNESLVERSQTFSPNHVAWWLVIEYLIVITATPVYLWRQRAHFQNPEYGLILFMFWTIVFVSAAGILLDLGENNRARFGIDPLILLLFLFFIRRSILAFKDKFKKPGL